jgi:putative transposase
MSEKYKIFDSNWIYFVTFTTVRWIDVFTRPQYRDIIIDSLNYCIQAKGLRVHSWVLMTNHMHLVIHSNDMPIEFIVRDFKRHTSKTLYECIRDNPKESRDWMIYLMERAGKYNSMNNDYQFWQNGYHPVHLHSEDLILQRMNYTHLNPVRAGFVDFPHQWKFSSAQDYMGSKGLVQLEPLYPISVGRGMIL